MNNEELKELAAVLNGIADGKKWEARWGSNDWFETSQWTPIRAIQNGYEIRLKQWHLPDPPQGYEWHRVDGWTEEMLPDRWRPQYVGEIGTPYELSYDGVIWHLGTFSGSETNKSSAQFWRTKAPLPPPKPQLREVPLCADDIKAGDEFLSPASNRRYPYQHVDNVRVGLHGTEYSFQHLMDGGWKIRSIGETEWRKCSRMEEVPA